MAISGCQMLPAGATKRGSSSWPSGRVLASHVAARGSNPRGAGYFVYLCFLYVWSEMGLQKWNGSSKMELRNGASNMVLKEASMDKEHARLSFISIYQ